MQEGVGDEFGDRDLRVVGVLLLTEFTQPVDDETSRLRDGVQGPAQTQIGRLDHRTLPLPPTAHSGQRLLCASVAQELRLLRFY